MSPYRSGALQWLLMPPATASLETLVGPWEKGLFDLSPLTHYVVEDDIDFLILLPPLPSTGMTCSVYNGTQGFVYARQVSVNWTSSLTPRRGGPMPDFSEAESCQGVGCGAPLHLGPMHPFTTQSP